jgi:hypothetical protein
MSWFKPLMQTAEASAVPYEINGNTSEAAAEIIDEELAIREGVVRFDTET